MLQASGILGRRVRSLQPLWPRCLQTSAPLDRTSFFNTRSVDKMWKSVTSVSNQGRQKGRAKGLMRYKNLNIGQKLGYGRTKTSFPGLTTFTLDKNRTMQKISSISDTTYQSYEDRLIELRSKMALQRSRTREKNPLERGWTGGHPIGRRFGAPTLSSVAGDEDFEQFDSILMEYRMVQKMTGTFGRVKYMRLVMLTGNRNGTIGMSLIQVPQGKGPRMFLKAINRAAQRLITIDRYENRTVFHDFFTQFGQSRIFVQQLPPGSGVDAHRIIKAVCELVGIKDVKCTVEGSKNPLHFVRAFLLGLLRQRSHQVLANEKRLHLVELREENDNYPKLVASPTNGPVRTEQEISYNENLSFELVCFEGNVPYYRPEPELFWTRLPSYQIRLKKIKPQEHHFQQRIQMIVDQGRVASHLTDKFPECTPPVFDKMQLKRFRQTE